MAVKVLRSWLEFIRDEYADIPAVGAFAIVLSFVVVCFITYGLLWLVWNGRPLSVIVASFFVGALWWAYRWIKEPR